MPPFLEPHLDIGIAAQSGVGLDGSGVGIHVEEWNGVVTRFLFMLPVAAALEVSVQRSDRVGWAHKDTWYTESGQLVGSATEERDKDNNLVKSTSSGVGLGAKYHREEEVAVFTPRSEANIAAQLKARDNAMAGMLALPMHTDVTYLPNRDDDHVYGIRAAFYALAFPVTDWLEIATGYYGERLHATHMDGARYLHRARGVPVRVVVAPRRWLALELGYLCNLVGLANDPHEHVDFDSAVRGSIALALPGVEKLFVKLAVERTGLSSSGTWGTTVEGGVRF